MNPAILEPLLLLLLRPWKALRIGYLRITGRRLRARLQFREAAAALPFAYAQWERRCTRADCGALASAVAEASDIAVHLHFVKSTFPKDFSRSVRSVTRQAWPHWRLIVTSQDGTAPGLPDDSRIAVIDGAFDSYGAGLKAALSSAGTQYLVPLRQGCRLPRMALARYAAHLRSVLADRFPILYGDQDEFDRFGWRRNPWFKPEWDPEMFLAQDYLSAALAIPIRLGGDIQADESDEAAIYGMLLRATMRPGQQVQHLHRITVSTPQGHWRRPEAGRLALLRGALAGTPGTEVLAGPFGTASIQWPLPASAPLVSVIVPTRDQVALLKTCVGGLLCQTRYPNLEIVIADNDSREPATHAFLEEISADPRVRVVTWPHPFNYSAINNFAVTQARGEHLLFLNNDTEVLEPRWLETLLAHSQRPEVGVVGAKLLYGDDTVQHSGVIVGIGGVAGHAHLFLAADEPGYFSRAQLAQNLSAVTFACAMTRRDVFERVGGLNEKELRIAFNDVDFCLRVREAGYLIVYAPDAVLHHYESKSRGYEDTAEKQLRFAGEIRYMQQRHAGVLEAGDPYYNPNLSLTHCYAPDAGYADALPL